jgi:hypothetical protein
MKERLKAKAPRTLEALEAELKPALDTITAKDAEAGSGTPAMPYTDPKSALGRIASRMAAKHVVSEPICCPRAKRRRC